jgi:hypothetical protein
VPTDSQFYNGGRVTGDVAAGILGIAEIIGGSGLGGGGLAACGSGGGCVLTGPALLAGNDLIAHGILVTGSGAINLGRDLTNFFAQENERTGSAETGAQAGGSNTTGRPSSGVGGNGSTSEFGDLTGLTRKEVDTFLRERGAIVKPPTPSGYIEYKFPDRSTVTIRPDGEVVRTPAPKYGSDGARINRGLRLDKDGNLLKTLDKSGNQISGTHNTREKVSD